MEDSKKGLLLRIITPSGIDCELECRSVKLPVKDSASGKNGGSYGIHPGHLRSLFALAEGEVTAISDEKRSFRVKSGFASVADDVVTVLADK